MNQLFMLGGAFFAFGHKPRFQTLTLNAMPGARYRVDGHVIELVPDIPEYCAWIENEVTHEIVGGAKECHNPPPPEPDSQESN